MINSSMISIRLKVIVIPDEFADRTVKRIIESETDKQVSPEAATELADELEGKARELAEEAVETADAFNRVTVRASDVQKVVDR